MTDTASHDLADDDFLDSGAVDHLNVG